MATQAEAFCKQVAACGGSKVTKEQFQQLVPQLLCKISNTAFLGFLCDPTDGFPVFLQYSLDPQEETVTILAFRADGTPYLEDLSLLETCGGGSGPATLEEMEPEDLVSMLFSDIDENYSIAMTSVNPKLYLSFWNRTDADLLVSKNGTDDFQIVGINQNLRLDPGQVSKKWGTNVYVRAVDSSNTPTTGTFYVAAYY